MLQRLANLVLGGVISALAGSMILLHLASSAPPQTWVLLFGGVLLVSAGGCFWAGLTVGPRSAQTGPVLPAAGVEAAWRLRELKRTTASRYRGLRGLSLAPWKL